MAAEQRAVDGFTRLGAVRCIDELHADNPAVRGNMFAALSTVQPTHLLDGQLRQLYGLDRMVGADEGLADIEGSCG